MPFLPFDLLLGKEQVPFYALFDGDKPSRIPILGTYSSFKCPSHITSSHKSLWSQIWLVLSALPAMANLRCPAHNLFVFWHVSTYSRWKMLTHWQHQDKIYWLKRQVTDPYDIIRSTSENYTARMRESTNFRHDPHPQLLFLAATALENYLFARGLIHLYNSCVPELCQLCQRVSQ